MGDALDLKDAETEGHSKRVTAFTIAIARAMGLSGDKIRVIARGAFLHDIGKVHELSFARTFAYTTRGQLLGHMIIELEMLQEKIVQVPGFPPEYKTLLEHMIISHHGKYEFGSPKMPMFPEALMLHYLDDLDSKMESMRAHFERERDEEWTGYNASLERPLLNSRKFLEKLRAGENTSNAAAAAAASATTSETETK